MRIFVVVGFRVVVVVVTFTGFCLTVGLCGFLVVVVVGLLVVVVLMIGARVTLAIVAVLPLR